MRDRSRTRFTAIRMPMSLSSPEKPDAAKAEAMAFFAAIFLFLIFVLVFPIPGEAGEAALLKAGYRHFSAGEWPEAAAAFERFLEKNPSHARSLTDLGHVYIQLKQYRKALEVVEKALRISPENPLALFRRGRVLLLMKDFHAAVSDLNQVKILAPNLIPEWTHYNLGRAFQELEEWEKAIQAYKKAYRANPGVMESNKYYYIVLGYSHVGWEKYGEGLRYFKEGLERFPNDKEILTAITLAKYGIKKSREDKKHAKLMARIKRRPPVVFDLPFEGKWEVLSGNNGLSPTHKGLWGAYAWDFWKVNRNERPFSGAGTKNAEYPTFGENILAPGDGVVHSVRDGIPDNIPHEDFSRKMKGNQVLIRHAQGVHSFMDHLKNGSIVVREGQKVKKGQVVAQAGNSGYSPFPHLHMTFFIFEHGLFVSIPGNFRNYELKRGRKIMTVLQGVPQKADIVSHHPEE